MIRNTLALLPFSHPVSGHHDAAAIAVHVEGIVP